MDRFLLSENINNKDEDKPTYILQTVKFKMLLEIVPYEEQEELRYDLSDVFDLFVYTNPDNEIERFMLIVREFYDIDTEEEIDHNIDKIRKQIKKAWNWYKAYLIKNNK